MTLLPAPLRYRVARALRSRAEVIHCVSRRECEAMLSDVHADYVVIDPLFLELADLIRLLEHDAISELQLVFFIPPTSAAIRRFLVVSQSHLVEVLLVGAEDSPQGILNAFPVIAKRSIQAELVELLSGPLINLRSDVSGCLFTILVDPSWSTAKQLPAMSGVSRRTLDRALVERRLAPLHSWCSVSKVMRSFDLVARDHATSSRAATMVGYASTRTLNRQCVSITGMPMPAAAHLLLQVDFVRLAAAKLLSVA
jgi:hypothetical protein